MREKGENGREKVTCRSFIFKYFSFSSINILGELVVACQRTVKVRDILKIASDSGENRNYSSKGKCWSTLRPFLKSIPSLMKKTYQAHFHFAHL